MIKIIKQSVSVLLVFMLLHNTKTALASNPVENAKQEYKKLQDFLNGTNAWNRYCDQSVLDGLMVIQAGKKNYLNQHKKPNHSANKLSEHHKKLLFSKFPSDRLGSTYERWSACRQCDFSNVSLEQSNIDFMQFYDCNFDNANFSYSTFGSVVFSDGSFESSNFKNSVFENRLFIVNKKNAPINFKHSNWSGAKLLEGKIEGPIFSCSTFHKTSFGTCRLVNPNFDGCDLTSTDLKAENIIINIHAPYDPSNESDGWKGTRVTWQQAQYLRPKLTPEQYRSLIIDKDLRKSFAGCV